MMRARQEVKADLAKILHMTTNDQSKRLYDDREAQFRCAEVQLEVLLDIREMLIERRPALVQGSQERAHE